MFLINIQLDIVDNNKIVGSFVENGMTSVSVSFIVSVNHEMK